MAVISAEFEAGVNGNTIAATDTGSQTAWDIVTIGAGGSLVYDTAHPAAGTLGAKIVAVFSNDTFLEWTTQLGTVTNHFGRLYLYRTAVPSGAFTLLWFRSSGSSVAKITMDTTGNLHAIQGAVTDAGNVATPVALNQLVRVEYQVIHSATVGQIIIKLYNNATSTTLTDSLTTSANLNTGASCNDVRIGFGSNLDATTMWLDAILENCTAFPGPFPVNTTAATVSGSSTVGSILTPNAGTWNNGGSFTLTYQWTRDGSNIGGATSSTYTTQAADVGHAVGVIETATGTQATNENATQASSNTITVTGTPATLASGPKDDGSTLWTLYG